MKILVFSQCFFPEQFLINDIVFRLCQNKHDVTVITGLPNYPEGKIPNEYKHHKNRHQNINGVDVVRCNIIPRGKSKFKLLLNYISYMFDAYRVSKKLKKKFDVVFCYETTPITQVYPAYKYCKKNKIKLFLYNCDLAPMCGQEYLYNKRIINNFYKKFSKWIMNKCDSIGVTSPSFIKYNNEINDVPNSKMFYLPQHSPDLFLNYSLSTLNNDVVDFMFAGNISRGLNLETIIYASNELLANHKNNFIIHIVGDGNYLVEIKKLVNKLGLSKYYYFHGRYPIEKMLDIYKIADALLITLRPNQTTIPSKLQTYMAVGKPIFGALDGDGKELIKESNSGDCCDASNYKQLATIMADYIDHPELYKKCGDNARTYFENNFTLSKYINILEKELQRLGDLKNVDF